MDSMPVKFYKNNLYKNIASTTITEFNCHQGRIRGLISYKIFISYSAVWVSSETS